MLACRRDAGVGANAGPRAAGTRALVARVGSVEIRDEDLKRAMERDPGASAVRFSTPEARRGLVDGLVRFELLAQAADRAGLMKDPDAIHAQQQIAVTKLINRELAAVPSPEDIAKADVEREYAARRDAEFTVPEAVNVRHIRVADAARAEKIVRAAKALAPADDRGFATLAAAESEDALTRNQGGDLGFVEARSRLPREMRDAALALRDPGALAGPVKTDDGYEILRLVSRRSAAVSGFADVEETLRQRLYRDRRAKALEDLIARLRAATPVEIAGEPVSAAPAPRH